ncbi:hypothetical protein RCH14_001409 [Massilia sp. MP_M2]
MYLYARYLGRQGKPTLIHQQIVFAAGFAAIGRVSTGYCLANN